MKIDRNNLLPLSLCLLGVAIPLTISAAEGFLFLALLLGAWLLAQRDVRFPTRSPYWVPILLFVLVASASVFWSERPGQSLGRLHRLLFPVVILVMGLQWPDGTRLPRRWLRYGVVGFLLGVGILGVSDLVRIPYEVNHGTGWFDAGNMRDPQMYLVSLCLLVALWLCPGCRGWRPFLTIGTVLSLVGILLHFKRGVWASLVLAMLLLSMLTRRWVILGLMLVLAGSAALLPQVRDRMMDLKIVNEVSLGGRYALWTDVAPKLIADHPLGVGWGAMQHGDLAQHAAYVQPKLNHLHNNILQLTAEVGWLGLAAWLLWMGTACLVLLRLTRRARGCEKMDDAIALGALCGLVGLLANGMVEYNFGDSEVLLLYCLLMGWSEWMREPDPTDAGLS